MITNEVSITINRPIAEVFSYVSDLQHGPQWQSGLLEMRQTTEGPLGTGTQFTSARKFLGRRMEAAIELVAYEPTNSFAIKSISGTPFKQSFHFEAAPKGTSLTTVLEMQAAGFMGLAEPLIASSVRREMDADLGDLKDLLEAQVPVTA